MGEPIQNDMRLVQDAQKGDENALCRLYEGYLPLIYRYCFVQCGHRETAEDLTSEIFMKMVRQLPSFRHQSSFKNWLYAIAKRTVADYWRRQYRTPIVPLEEHYASAKPDESFFDSDQEIDALTSMTEQKVETILQNLPINYRAVLECRFIKNMSITETADVLDESEENIKVLQHRALKKAAQLLNII